MSFGSEAVDAQGVVRDFLSRSALTGLLANALGWERYEVELLELLQERLIFGVALLERGMRVKDFQTVKLAPNDRGWTTHGVPEGRTGSTVTYQYPYIRHRYADAGGRALVAFRLSPAACDPCLDQLAHALDHPERPLFIGRKPFIPSTRLLHSAVEAENVRRALAIGIGRFGKTEARAQWPIAEGRGSDSTVVELTDERNWKAGVHAGLRRVREGLVTAEPGQS